MFHTAQTDMAATPAQPLATDAHRRAVLTTVLGNEESADDGATRPSSEDVADEGEQAAAPADTQR